jgi:heptosyltransferase III
MDSILIIRGGAIGDFILTLPSIHALKDQYPKARIEVLGYPHIASLVNQRFYANAIRSIDSREVAAFFAKKGDLDGKWCEYFSSFDTAVSFLYDPDLTFRNNLERAGLHTIIAVDSRPTGERHAADFLGQWLEELKVPFTQKSPRLYPSEVDLKEAREAAGLTDGKKYVGVHIGSGSQTKNWTLSSFLDFVNWLKQEGWGVIVLEGPADMEVSQKFWSDPVSKDTIKFHGKPLPLVAALLKQCTAFVGHDSGISHIAAAVGTPTIAMFGPTNPYIWAPRGNVQVLRKGYSVSSIKVDDVKVALKPFLNKSGN